jgi:hypothetical protein
MASNLNEIRRNRSRERRPKIISAILALGLCKAYRGYGNFLATLWLLSFILRGEGRA